MRTLILIPTYNEIENVKPMVEAVLSNTPSEVDVLIIDDGSPDGTGQLADTLAKTSSRVQVMHREKKMGLGKAYSAGFKFGFERDYVAFVQMDADFSHNPRYLPTMLRLLEANDVVVGSRYVAGGGTLNWGLGRRILSRAGSVYARLILGAPFRDFTSGFCGFQRKVVEHIDVPSLQAGGYSYQIELKYRAFVRGYKLVEFPIVFEDRKVGASKMNGHIIAEALARIWSFRLTSIKQGYGRIGRLLHSKKAS